MRTLLLLLLLSLPAEARWRAEFANNPPEVQQWFKSQFNENGASCCGEADGHRFYGDYNLNADGSVTIYDTDGVHWLPPFMVLKGPNPTGAAIWWKQLLPDGTYRDYCFSPGGLF